MTKRLYTNKGKLALVSVLQKQIGNNNVINKNNNSNKNCDYMIKKKPFLESYNDNKIKNYNWNDDEIELNEYIKFLHLEEINKSNDSKGMFHEHMNHLHALYEVDVDYLPKYEQNSDKINNIIHPKRDEFLFVWWLIYNITIHNFIGLFKDIIGISYQQSIRKGDNRFYDLLFTKLNIIVEIQEAGKNHDKNLNDLTKEGMALLRGNRIFYFHIAQFKKHQFKYLKNFWYGNTNEIKLLYGKTEIIHEIGFETILIQALVSMDFENKHKVLTNFILYDSNIYYKNKTNNLKDEIKYYNDNKKNIKNKSIEMNKNENNMKLLTNYENILQNNNKEFTNILFGWYQDSFNGTDVYIIDPYSTEFSKIFKIVNNDMNKFLDLCYIGKYCGIVNKSDEYFDLKEYKHKNLRFSWNGLVNMFFQSSIKHDDDKEINITLNEEIISFLTKKQRISEYSKWMHELFINIERTYKKIILYIGVHDKECKNSSNEMVLRLENYIKDNLTINYQYKINELENKVEQQDEEIKFINMRSNKLIRKTTTLCKNVMKLKITKKVSQQLESIKNDVEEITNYKESKLTKYTIRFEKDKNIIIENTDIKIYYTDSVNDYVNYNTFIAYCNIKLIPHRIVQNIWKKLTPNNDKGVPENIFKIKINDPTFIVKNGLFNNFEDSNNESEQESDNNSEEYDESNESNESNESEVFNELLINNSKINKKIVAK